MASPEPLSPYRVTLPCGVFDVKARSIHAAILRAQADALDCGAFNEILVPRHIGGPDVEAEKIGSGGRAPVAPGISRVHQEPFITCSRAREVLAALKGTKKLDHYTLIRLVKHEGLPKIPDPFGSDRWCFLESAINDWFNTRTGTEQPRPMHGPGRPRKVPLSDPRQRA